MDKDHLAAAPEQHGELPEPVAWLYQHKTIASKSACVVKRMDSKIAGADEWWEMPVFTAEQLRTAIAAERERNPWRMVIDDALVTAHLDVATDDPYDDLNRLLDWHYDIWLDPAVSSDAQALIDRGAAASEAELSTLRTVMIAAAEEIAAHWDAHCDAEGYGPQNLIRRLEEGIQSEYGYTAGRFAELQAELSTLRQQLERTRPAPLSDERIVKVFLRAASDRAGFVTLEAGKPSVYMVDIVRMVERALFEGE